MTAVIKFRGYPSVSLPFCSHAHLLASLVTKNRKGGQCKQEATHNCSKLFVSAKRLNDGVS